MDNDEVLKKLKKNTSQVDDFIAEMEKMIALNKEHIAGNRAYVAKNKEKIAAIGAAMDKHKAITKYTKESLARMRQETRAIEEEIDLQSKAKALAVAQFERLNLETCKKH